MSSTDSNSPPLTRRNVVRGLYTVDHVLRRGHAETDVLSVRTVLTILLICGPIYGMAMGSYNWVAGHRSFTEQIPQMIYSAIKVPMLIVVTLTVAIPSFFVINTLLGLRDDFRTSFRAIVSAQSGLTIILASLLPLTLFSYVSISHLETGYQTSVLFNAAMFGVASISAQLLLRRYYRPLVQKNARHRWMIRFWIVAYAFIGIQAAYVLRPFIGNPDLQMTFFRRESFQNAYVKIWGLLTEIFNGIW